ASSLVLPTSSRSSRRKRLVVCVGMVSPSEEAEDSGVTSAARGCADARPTTGVGGASVPRRKGARIGRACNGSVGDQHVRKTHAADTNYAPHCDAPHCGPL